MDGEVNKGVHSLICWVKRPQTQLVAVGLNSQLRGVPVKVDILLRKIVSYADLCMLHLN